MIDIVSVKEAVKKGEIAAYVKDGVIFLKNDIGECVKIGEVEEEAALYTLEKYLVENGLADEVV